MPRTRATEVPQRLSPRGPSNLRISSSDSDPLHHRPRTERSPKLAEGRSPRGSQSEPVTQRKLGTRIADLESQLGQAQVELKSLKNQLVSAEAAKKAAQEQLEKKSKKNPKVPESMEIQEKHSTMKHQKVPESMEIQEKHSTSIESELMKKKDSSVVYETSDDVQQETDVFEVPIEKETVEPKTGVNQEELKPSPAMSEPENPSFDELALKNSEIDSLKTKLEEKEKQLEVSSQENESLKTELNEKSVKILSAECKIEELKTRLSKVDQELENTKTSAAQMNEKLEATEKAKEELESEMKRLRIQTEQWRKAADAAASVLAGGVEMNGRRVSERCGSMDKHYGSAFEHVGSGGYGGYVGSPGLMDDDADDVYGSGKRKGSGIRMFGDLWKKKGQK